MGALGVPMVGGFEPARVARIEERRARLAIQTREPETGRLRDGDAAVLDERRREALDEVAPGRDVRGVVAAAA